MVLLVAALLSANVAVPVIVRVSAATLLLEYVTVAAVDASYVFAPPLMVTLRVRTVMFAVAVAVEFGV